MIEPRCHRPRDFGEIDGLRVEDELVRLRPPQFGELAHQPAQPPGLRAEHVPRLRPGLDHAILESLQVSVEGRNRCPELVGDVGDQLEPPPFRGLERLRHRVEGHGEVADLPRLIVGDALCVMTAAERRVTGRAIRAATAALTTRAVSVAVTVAAARERSIACMKASRVTASMADPIGSPGRWPIASAK